MYVIRQGNVNLGNACDWHQYFYEVIQNNDLCFFTQAAYASKCSKINQLRCELGDQSMKTMTINIGNGRKLHTDIFQPLFGKFSGKVLFDVYSFGLITFTNDFKKGSFKENW